MAVSTYIATSDKWQYCDVIYGHIMAVEPWDSIISGDLCQKYPFFVDISFVYRLIVECS